MVKKITTTTIGHQTPSGTRLSTRTNPCSKHPRAGTCTNTTGTRGSTPPGNIPRGTRCKGTQEARDIEPRFKERHKGGLVQDPTQEGVDNLFNKEKRRVVGHRTAILP